VIEEEEKQQEHPHRRQKVLTAKDTQDLVSEMVRAIGINHKECRFDGISPEDLRQTILFCKNMNDWFDKTKSTIWQTTLVSLLLTIFAIFAIGYWHKSGH